MRYPPLALRIGNYHDLEQIGPGAFGTTYRARHQETGDVVAIKKLALTVGEHEHRGIIGTSDLLAIKELDHGDPLPVFHDPRDASKSVALLPREAQRLSKR